MTQPCLLLISVVIIIPVGFTSTFMFYYLPKSVWSARSSLFKCTGVTSSFLPLIDLVIYLFLKTTYQALPLLLKQREMNMVLLIE